MIMELGLKEIPPFLCDEGVGGYSESLVFFQSFTLAISLRIFPLPMTGAWGSSG